MPLLDEVLDDRGRNSVAHEPRCDPLRPVVASPHPFALGVVEPTLEDRGAGGAGRRLGSADVVRMEVGDRDALDLHGLPGDVADAETRVEEGAVGQVAVDVLRPGRERQRQPLNTVFELYERLFYTPC